MTKWERVNESTFRLRVPGGWLYQVARRLVKPAFATEWHQPVYVPDPEGDRG